MLRTALSFIIYAMPAKRKFRVRVRGKVRNQLLRRGGMAAGITLALAATAWFSVYAARNTRRIFGGPFFLFKPQAISVECPSAEVRASLEKLAEKAVHNPLTSAGAHEMERKIKSSFPSLASVRVSRNFITGKASVKAMPEQAVAPVLADGATCYLGVSGRFMAEDHSGAEPPAFRVELSRPPEPAEGLVAFLGEVKPLAGLFYSPPRVLSCRGREWDCRFTLEDGSEVLWGGFEFNRIKILRLNEVMGHALRRSGGPLRADLRSFREGKIFVSAIKTDR